jgi:hypothetical protein
LAHRLRKQKVVDTKAIHLAPSWTTSHLHQPIALKYVLSSFTLHLSLSTSSFKEFLLPLQLVLCVSSINFLALIITGWKDKLRSSSLCSFLHDPNTSSLVRPQKAIVLLQKSEGLGSNWISCCQVSFCA